MQSFNIHTVAIGATTPPFVVGEVAQDPDDAQDETRFDVLFQGVSR